MYSLKSYPKDALNFQHEMPDTFRDAKPKCCKKKTYRQIAFGAQRLYDNGEYSEALEVYNRLLSEEAGKTIAELKYLYLQRGACYIHTKDYRSATLDLRQVKNFNPSEATRINLDILTTYCHRNILNWEATSQGFQRLLAHAPDKPFILVNLGETCLQTGKFEAAVEYFLSALEIDPSHVLASTGLVMSYILLDETEFDRDLLSVCQTATTDPDIKKMLQCIGGFFTEKYTFVAKTLEKLIGKTHIRNSILLLFLARAYLLDGKPVEAQKSIDRVTALIPNHAYAHKYMGDCAFMRGDFITSAHCYTRAMPLTASPALKSQIDFSLSESYLAQHNWEAMYAHCGEWIGREPENSLAHERLADLVMNVLGDYDKAIIEYNNAINTAQEDLTPTFKLFELYLILGVPETTDLLEQLGDADEESLPAEYLAHRQFLSKDYPKAIKSYKKIIQKSEKDGSSRETLRVLYGLALYRNEKISDAKKIFLSIHRNLPDNPFVLFCVCECAIAGSEKDWTKYAEGVLKLAPDYLPAHKVLARYHFAEGNFDIAANHLSILLQKVTDLQANYVRMAIDVQMFFGQYENAAYNFDRLESVLRSPFTEEDTLKLSLAYLFDGNALQASELLESYYEDRALPDFARAIVAVSKSDNIDALKAAKTYIKDVLKSLKPSKKSKSTSTQSLVQRLPYLLLMSQVCLGYFKFKRAKTKRTAMQECLDEILSINPDFPLAHYLYGKMLERDENPLAYTHYEKALALCPSDIRYHLALCDYAFNEKQWEKAAHSYERVLEIDRNYEWIQNLGTCYVHLGKFEEAARMYQMVYDHDASDGLLNVRLSVTYLLIEQNQKAIDILNHLPIVAPDYPQTKEQLAHIRYAKEDIVTAITSYNEMLETSGAEVDIIKVIMRGLGYLKLRDANAAIADLTYVLKYRPKQAFLLKLLGDAYQIKLDYNSAANCYQDAILANYGYTDAYWEIAKIAEITGRWRDGVSALTDLAKLEPDHIEIFEWLGDAYCAMDTMGIAFETYEKTLSLIIAQNNTAAMVRVTQKMVSLLLIEGQPEKAHYAIMGLSGIFPTIVPDEPDAQTDESDTEERGEVETKAEEGEEETSDEEVSDAIAPTPEPKAASIQWVAHSSDSPDFVLIKEAMAPFLTLLDTEAENATKIAALTTHISSTFTDTSPFGHIEQTLYTLLSNVLLWLYQIEKHPPESQIELIKPCLEYAPHHAHLHKQMGTILLNSDTDKAIYHFRVAYRTSFRPDTGAILRKQLAMKAEYLFRHNNAANAFLCYREALDLTPQAHPEYIELRVGLSDCFQRIERGKLKEDLQKQINQLGYAVNEHGKLIEQVQAEGRRRDAHIATLDAKHTALESRVTRTEANVATVAGQVMQLHDRVTRHDAMLEDIDYKLATHTSQLRQHGKIIGNLASQVDEHGRVITRNAAAIASNSARVGRAEAKIEHTAAAVATNRQSIIKNSHAINQNRRTLSQHHRTLINHQSQISRNTRNIRLNRINIKKTSERVSHLAARQTRTERTLDATRSMVFKNRSILTKHGKLISANSKNIGVLNHKVRENRLRLNAHDKTLSLHSRQIASNRSHIGSLSERVSRHDVQIANHGARLDRHEDRLDFHGRVLRKHDQQIAETQRDVSVLGSRVDHHDVRLADHDRRIHRGEMRADRHEAALRSRARPAARKPSRYFASVNMGIRSGVNVKLGRRLANGKTVYAGVKAGFGGIGPYAGASKRTASGAVVSAQVGTTGFSASAQKGGNSISFGSEGFGFNKAFQIGGNSFSVGTSGIGMRSQTVTSGGAVISTGKGPGGLHGSLQKTFFGGRLSGSISLSGIDSPLSDFGYQQSFSEDSIQDSLLDNIGVGSIESDSLSESYTPETIIVPSIDALDDAASFNETLDQISIDQASQSALPVFMGDSEAAEKATGSFYRFGRKTASEPEPFAGAGVDMREVTPRIAETEKAEEELNQQFELENHYQRRLMRGNGISSLLAQKEMPAEEVPTRKPRKLFSNPYALGAGILASTATLLTEHVGTGADMTNPHDVEQSIARDSDLHKAYDHIENTHGEFGKIKDFLSAAGLENILGDWDWAVDRTVETGRKIKARHEFESKKHEYATPLSDLIDLQNLGFPVKQAYSFNPERQLQLKSDKNHQIKHDRLATGIGRAVGDSIKQVNPFEHIISGKMNPKNTEGLTKFLNPLISQQGAKMTEKAIKWYRPENPKLNIQRPAWYELSQEAAYQIPKLGPEPQPGWKHFSRDALPPKLPTFPPPVKLGPHPLPSSPSTPFLNVLDSNRFPKPSTRSPFPSQRFELQMPGDMVG